MELGTLKVVNFTDITFDESIRGRIDYGDINELAQSIQEQGLINPITVYSPSLTPPYELLAGGRRYKALELLGATLVSVRIYDKELTDKEKRLVELIENIRRKDISFIEQANMTKMFHETLQSIHGQKLPGGASIGHSTRDTADLLGVSQQTVNNSLKIATVHKQFPELALGEKKNAAAALHTINRLEYAVKVRVNNPNIAQSAMAENYRIGDFFAINLDEIGKFSFIEIDPPYGIDLKDIKRHHKDTDYQGYNEVTKDDYEEFIYKVMYKCTNLAAQDAYLVIWTPPQWYHLIYTTLKDFNWDVDHVPAIWFKTNSNGQTRSAEYWLAGVHEPFLYAKRGNARLAREGRNNIYSYPIIHPSKKIHPTEKPYELMQDILNTFCLPGSSVLVPFAGSGVTIATAYDLGHQVIGYDLNPAYREEFLIKFGDRNEP